MPKNGKPDLKRTTDTTSRKNAWLNFKRRAGKDTFLTAMRAFVCYEPEIDDDVEAAIRRAGRKGRPLSKMPSRDRRCLLEIIFSDFGRTWKVQRQVGKRLDPRQMGDRVLRAIYPLGTLSVLKRKVRSDLPHINTHAQIYLLRWLENATSGKLSLPKRDPQDPAARVDFVLSGIVALDALEQLPKQVIFRSVRLENIEGVAFL